MSTQDIRVRIGLEGADQVQANARRASEALGGLAANSKALGAANQITGQQTAQLSAQLQDFAVQVQGGANPLTAFLQQGSQLSAVFGGAGNALRAVASLITPTVAAFGAAAAAIGTVAFAYAKGESERMAFERGIVSTGNAAGVTAGQLNELAKAAQRYGATRGDSSAVLAELVSTGRVAGSVLGQAAEAAIRLERAGVASVKETVDAFADLGKAPLQALLRLNETQNFLTESTYRQVRALQDAGKETEAARVAQQAFAQAGIERGRELEQSVGVLVTQWRTLTREIRNAIDAIADIGRVKGPEGAIEDIDKRLAQLALRRQSGRRVDSNTASDFLAGQDQIEAEAQALERLRAQLAAGIETQRALAAAQAAGVESTKQKIAADEKAADAAKRHADALRRQLEAQIEAGTRLARGGELEAAGFSGDFLTKYQELVAAQKAGRISAEEFARAQQRLIQQQPVIANGLAAVTRIAKEAASAYERNVRALESSADAAEKQVETLRQQYIELTGGKEALRAYTELRLGDALAIAEQRLQTLYLVAASADEIAAAQRNVQALREQLQLRKQINDATGQQEAAAARRKVEDEDAAARQRLFDDYRDGLTQAFRSAFLQGGDFGKNFAKGLAAEVKARMATALAELLTAQVLGAIGSAVLGGGGSAGAAGGGSGSLLQSLGLLNNGYNAMNGGAGWLKVADGYLANSSWGQALGWSTATAGTGLTGYTGTGLMLSTAGTASGSGLTGYLGANTLAGSGLGGTGAGLSGAGSGTWAGMFANEAATTGATVSSGSSAAGSASLGAYAAYAALIYAAAQYGSALYDKGFTGSAQLEGKDWYKGTFEAAKTDVLKKLGLSDKWAEILGGSVRLNHMFGRSEARLTDTGVTGTLGQGGFAGEQYAIYTAKGGLFRGDKQTGVYQAPSEDLQGFLADQAKGLYDAAFKYGEALGLPTQALEKVNTALAVKFTDDVHANSQALQAELARYATDLVNSFGEAVAPLRRYGEDVVDTIARVSQSINDVNTVLGALGLRKLDTSIAGGQASEAVLANFGGVGGLQQSASGFLQNFYTDKERADLTLKSINEQLAAVGLAAPASRDAFRDLVTTLVDGGALMDQKGREQVAVLFGVADAFAAVTEAGRSAADVAREAQQIQLDTWRALGDDSAIKAFERSQIAPENLKAYDELQAILAKRDAEAKAAAEAEALRRSASQSASDYWQDQVDAAETARSAWADVAASIAEQIRRLRGEGPGANTLAGFAAAQANFTTTAAQAQAGSLEAARQLPQLTQDLSRFFEQVATSTTDLALMRARTAATLEEVLRRNGQAVPAFAAGGVHAGGLRLVGESGPELEVTGPARIYSAEQTRDMLGGGATGAEAVAELRALRQVVDALRSDNAALRSRLDAVADNTDRLQRLFAEVTDGGNAMRTEVIA